MTDSTALLDRLSSLDDPYPTYAALRSAGPVWHERWGVTVFSRHADVAAILRDRRFGRDPRGVLPPDALDQRIYPRAYPTWTRYIRSSFMELEPPAHTRLRSLVAAAFSRKRVESLRPLLESAALEALRGADRVDIVSGLATAVPLAAIGALLGIPPADRPRIVEWSHRIVRLFDPDVSDADGMAAETATIEFVDYVRALMATSGNNDDLISALMLADTDETRLTEDEIIATSILLLNAGHEATVHAIANAVHAIAAHAELGRVVGPELVDELLRFDPPLHYFERWALDDVAWAGLRFAPGDRVALLLAAANRDEEVHSDPDVIRPGRSTAHVSFGAGIHRCLGAALARVEIEIALQALVHHFGAVTIAEPPTRHVSLIFRGFNRLAVTASPA